MTGGLFAGFDLGGTQLKFGLIGEDGAIIFKDRIPTPGSIDGLVDSIAGTMGRLGNLYPGRIRSAGFGFAGFYSLRERKILHSPNYPSLNNVDIVPALERVLDVPFEIDNDANMAAYGEWKYGAGRGARSLVLLTIGTGIGSGIILDGGLWHGQCGFAGELGHITINPEGTRCNCGNIGCLETEASAPKIARNYVALTGKDEGLTAEDIDKLARRGDRAAIESFARCGYYLGIGLGIVINFLNPEKIILGGGVMTTGEFLLDPALEEARRRSHRVSFACTSIVKASLGNDAGLIGAASWARDKAGSPLPDRT
jgi:glucokinase